MRSPVAALSSLSQAASWRWRWVDQITETAATARQSISTRVMFRRYAAADGAEAVLPKGLRPPT